MYADWQAAARHFIAEVDASLPPDADLNTRRAALRKAASHFHGGTSWGKKVWSKHSRKYLEKHGLAPLPPRGAENSPNFGPDIIFPYREGASV